MIELIDVIKAKNCMMDSCCKHNEIKELYDHVVTHIIKNPKFCDLIRSTVKVNI